MENRYDKYKDSGIAWIGEIPEHWSLVSIGKLFNVYAGGDAKPDYYSDTKDSEHPFPVYTNTRSEHEIYAYTSKAIFPANTITVTGRGDVGHAIYRKTPYDAIIRLLSLTPKNNYDCRFYTYFIDIVIPFMDGKSAVAQLSSLQLKPQLVCLPSNEEQQSIATYLDQKCSEIDKLITLQEEMITKLQSYKQSVITESVTKGLDKNVPLKDSGIEWIGEIPEHWEASKTLFNLSMPITDGPHTTPELFEIGIPFVSAEAVSFGNGRIDFSRIRGYISENFYQECCKKYVPQVDDIYMIKSGATTGRVAIVDTDIKFTIWSPLAVFRCNKERMLPRFLFYQLQSNGYQKQIELNWSYGTQQNIGMRTLEKLILSVPPLSEQQSIADYLDQKCSEIDELISIKQQKIEKLKDYKKSLIFECVTGKRKVS